MDIGSKIKFRAEKQRYTVRAMSSRFIICTKPFNLQKTVLYCVIDVLLHRRGPINYVFSPFDFAKDEDCERCLQELRVGKCKVSERRWRYLELDIEEVD